MATQSASHTSIPPSSPVPPAQALPVTEIGLREQGAQRMQAAAQHGAAADPAADEEAANREMANREMAKPGAGSGPAPAANGVDPQGEFDHGGLHLSPACARLPVSLAVTVPVREFRVRKLLAMAPGEIIETQWGHGEDLPIASGDVQLAWSEFEVVDTRLAVRVTRLA